MRAPAYSIPRLTRDSGGCTVIGEDETTPASRDRDGRLEEGEQAYCMTMPPPCRTQSPGTDVGEYAVLEMYMYPPKKLSKTPTHHTVSKQKELVGAVLAYFPSNEEFYILQLTLEICYTFCIGLLSRSAPAALIKSECGDASLC